jgi:hypothetical protein
MAAEARATLLAAGFSGSLAVNARGATDAVWNPRESMRTTSSSWTPVNCTQRLAPRLAGNSMSDLPGRAMGMTVPRAWY